MWFDHWVRGRVDESIEEAIVEEIKGAGSTDAQVEILANMFATMVAYIGEGCAFKIMQEHGSYYRPTTVHKLEG